jgi:UDP-3-O-[3-hydroxymyristoyl] glucosamine N-acyltransferase
MKLSELVEHLPDCYLDQSNANDPEITGVAAIAQAKTGELSFINSEQYLPLLKTSQASAIILDTQTPCDLPCIRTKHPRILFAKAIALFYQSVQLPLGVHPQAVLGNNVKIGQDVAIAAGVVIDHGVEIGDRVAIFANTTIYPQVKIGAGTVIHAGCVIREHTEIGENCLIHANTVIGADGFGFELEPSGSWYKIPQSGFVKIGDWVEIGALCAIDRPAVGLTSIGSGTKIDNLVQIGHGCQIGDHCIIVAQVGMAGAVNLGHHVTLAGQVGIGDRLKIGDRAIVGGKSGVIADIEAGARVVGYPTVPERAWKRNMVAQQQLPDMIKTLRQLEKRILELEAKLSTSAK